MFAQQMFTPFLESRFDLLEDCCDGPITCGTCESSILSCGARPAYRCAEAPFASLAFAQATLIARQSTAKSPSRDITRNCLKTKAKWTQGCGNTRDGRAAQSRERHLRRSRGRLDGRKNRARQTDAAKWRPSTKAWASASAPSVAPSRASTWAPSTGARRRSAPTVQGRCRRRAHAKCRRPSW